MKAHLTKVSLALLSTVFLLGCQDMGSRPVGPEGLGPEFGHKDGHTKGGGGGGGGPKPEDVFVDVIATDGMNGMNGMKTATNNVQQMELVRRDDVLRLRGYAPKFGEPYFLVEVAMTKTYAKDWRNICETGHGDTDTLLMNDVFTNLIEGLTEREVSFGIDKSALVNGDHHIWVTNGPGLVKISPSTVTVNSGDIDTDSFSVTFSGGQVKLGGTLLEPSPPNKFASELFCDNLDKITFAVGMKPPAAD